MQITVKLFALMREKAGTDTVVLEVPVDAKLNQVIAALVRHYPMLEPYMPNTRYALHMDFIGLETSLAEGDELALIPPVSGGV
jgi:molybdopterin converting factor small subunit